MAVQVPDRVPNKRLCDAAWPGAAAAREIRSAAKPDESRKSWQLAARRLRAGRTGLPRRPVMAPRKLPYREGDVFAVPLQDGAYGIGVVARMDREGAVLGYFFDRRYESVP